MTDLEQLLHNLSHLSIDQMLELIKRSEKTVDRRFRATGPKGSIEGVVVDPWIGIIQFDGEEDIHLARQFRFVTDITFELI